MPYFTLPYLARVPDWDGLDWVYLPSMHDLPRRAGKDKGGTS